MKPSWQAISRLDMDMITQITMPMVLSSLYNSRHDLFHFYILPPFDIRT